MQPDVDRLAHALALSREADRLIADLEPAIRCPCCPVDGPMEHDSPGTDEQPAAPARALRRSDFLGMLEKHEVDAELGGAD